MTAPLGPRTGRRKVKTAEQLTFERFGQAVWPFFCSAYPFLPIDDGSRFLSPGGPSAARTRAEVSLAQPHSTLDATENFALVSKWQAVSRRGAE